MLPFRLVTVLLMMMTALTGLFLRRSLAGPGSVIEIERRARAGVGVFGKFNLGLVGKGDSVAAGRKINHKKGCQSRKQGFQHQTISSVGGKKSKPCLAPTN